MFQTHGTFAYIRTCISMINMAVEDRSIEPIPSGSMLGISMIVLFVMMINV